MQYINSCVIFDNHIQIRLRITMKNALNEN